MPENTNTFPLQACRATIELRTADDGQALIRVLKVCDRPNMTEL